MKDSSSKQQKSQHPWQVRVFHSVNIAVVFLMAASGMQIYNATPVFGGKEGWHIPAALTLGGWLAGGRHWHFAVMWIFTLNLIFFLIYLIATKRWQTRYANKADASALVSTKTTAKRRDYAFHRILYSFVLPFLLLAVFSGVTMYKPVQFEWLANLFGNWQNLRIIHFITVPLLAVFILVHSILGLKIGGLRTLKSIFWR